MSSLPGRPLISGAAIARRTTTLARGIGARHAKIPLTVLGLMNGSLFFLADLARLLPLETRIECWRLQSYAGRKSSGMVQGLEQCLGDFAGRRVVIVDDILDTGRTLDAVKRRVLALGAARVEICVLLKKKRKREIPIRAEWVGFEIPDRYVVGYGLDDDGRYRALRSIRALD
jgi:hypoxanthine phosphoribosyltransferase